MKNTQRSKSTGPKSAKGKSISASNATTHGLTSTRALPDEIQMVDEFVKELTNYYKPQSPLEVLQIQRIAFCRAKLAKMIDIEVAGRELYRREIESHPELVFKKLNQYSDEVKYLASLELCDQSSLKYLNIDKGCLQLIAKEIREFTGKVVSESDLPKLFPNLTLYFNKSKIFSIHSDDLDWDQKLLIFVSKIKISSTEFTTISGKKGEYEEMLKQIDLVKEPEILASNRKERFFKYGADSYSSLIKDDFKVITDFASNVLQIKTVLQSYDEMKSWMLRSIDLNAQESERMMRYQTTLEKRLSTAIGELLELQKIGKISSN